jgi:CheY-like chemotaxis protein
MSSEKIIILLAEDNPGDARLTEEAFKDAKLDHELHHVKDGLEAIAFLKKEGDYSDAPTPDIMLLDINMPKADGLDVLKVLKDDERLSRLPVIVLTTSNAERDIAKAYTLNANCFVKKPVDFDEFMDVVRGIGSFWFSIVKLPSKD